MSTNIFNPVDKRKYPSRWLLYRGKQLFRVIDERSNKGIEELLSVSHITGITPRSQKNVTMFKSESLIGYKLCQIGDIAANTMWTWQGAIGVSKYYGVVSPAYNVYRQKKEYFNPEYLDLLLREHQLVDVYHSLSTGIRPSRLRLYPDVFLTIDFPVPPRDEQDQIVHFLDWKVSEINKKISLKRQSLDLLKELVNSAFATLISSAFEKVRLKRVASLESDYIEINPDDYYKKAGMYNRGRGIFLRDPIKGTEMGDSKFQRIHSDRLMISGQFAWEDAVFVTSPKDEEGVASHRYYLLKSINHDVPVEFLFGYFLSQKGFSDLKQCSHGSAGRNRPLNINELLRIEVPIVHDHEAISKLCNLVHAYMAMRPIVLHEEAILGELRNRIISDVITGKIDVRNVTVPEYEHVDDIVDDDSENNEETETDGEEA
ncbi:restriction endonuclease subunit S [uncultured Dialister sp.]|uniref:restriction endonuclease subunit S n=1 Tax=uncultured Dialister sp. TaxID=278064 RepID=UPI00265F140C|nr:restriction endonuclease subunit S [uncultured Dialister sp.]